MTVADALMLALGAIAVGSAALVVTSAHLVRSGLYLVVSMGAIAGLYLVMGAEMVAWVQVLVYVGAVVVLLLFAVMLTRAPIGPSDDLDRPAGPAALIGAGVGVGLTVLLADAFHWTRYDLPPTGTARRIGEQVFGAWVLPFEVLSILLLAALVGAIVLSRPDLGARPGPAAAAVPAEPVPDPSTESDAVSARLERIAARQASAQARMRQAAAEERATAAAAERAAAAQPAEAATSTITADPVDQARKGRAHDVIFGAHERRARVGDDMPDESRTMEGTATERPTPQRRPTTRRPAIEGTIEGEVVEDRPALPSGKNDSRNDGEKAGGEDA